MGNSAVIVAVEKNEKTVVIDHRGGALYEVIESDDQSGKSGPKVGTRLTMPELVKDYPLIEFKKNWRKAADYKTGKIYSI